MAEQCIASIGFEAIGRDIAARIEPQGDPVGARLFTCAGVGHAVAEAAGHSAVSAHVSLILQSRRARQTRSALCMPSTYLAHRFWPIDLLHRR